MSNIRSGVSRVVLNLSTSSPSADWPNYGSVMHQAYLSKVAAYGHELGAAARVPNPHYGTDIKPAGGVKQNIASFTWGRYANAYNTRQESYQYEAGGRHGDTRTGYRTSYYPMIMDLTVEHWADIPSATLGVGIDFFSLYRASGHHESFAGSYVTAVLYYRTAANPGYTHTLNYGHIMSWSTYDHQHQKNFDRALGDGSGFIYAKLVVRVYHGMGNWHDSGDRSPLNWSPDLPVCNSAHAVGISSNYWRTITNAGMGAYPHLDRATIYYKPSQPEINPPKKYYTPDKVLAGNGSVVIVGEYACPWFNSSPPPFYVPPASSGSGGTDSGHGGNRP